MIRQDFGKEVGFPIIRALFVTPPQWVSQFIIPLAFASEAVHFRVATSQTKIDIAEILALLKTLIAWKLAISTSN